MVSNTMVHHDHHVMVDGGFDMMVLVFYTNTITIFQYPIDHKLN